MELSTQEKIVEVMQSNGKMLVSRFGRTLSRPAITTLVSDAISTPIVDAALERLFKAVLKGRPASVDEIARKFVDAVIEESAQYIDEEKKNGAKYEFVSGNERESNDKKEIE